MLEEQTPQTTKQHPVPQNIMEVEFKLIGDLTIRQFGFVAVGGVIAFLAYKSGLPAIFRWPLTITSVALGLGMAFFPVQGRGLDKWILSFFNSIYSPTQMVWRKEPLPPAFLLSDYEHLVKSEIISLAPVKSRQKLQEFLKTLPTEEAKTPLDIEEEEFLKRIDFETRVPESLRAEAIPIEVTKLSEAPPEIIKELPKIPPKKPRDLLIKPVVSIAPKRMAVPKKLKLASEINFSEQPVFTIITPEAREEYIPAIKTVKPGRRLTALPSLEGEIVLPVRGEKVIPSFEDVERIKKEALARVEKEEITRSTSLFEELKIATERAKQQLREKISPEQPRAVKEKVSPDKERNRLEGQVKMLSSRVEELRKQAEGKKDAADIEKTISYYQKQIDQLQKRIEALAITQETRQKPVTAIDYQKQLAETQKQAEKLLSKIRKAKGEVEKIQKKIEEQPEEREVYEKELQKQKESVAEMERQRELNMERLTQMLRELRRVQRPAKIVIEPAEEKPKEEREEIPSDAVPNIISGTIETRKGHLLENKVVLVKDKNSDPVRALKTNKLGRFSITTPLPNGTYTVEVEGKEEQFDIIGIELNGSVLNPLRIVEK